MNLDDLLEIDPADPLTQRARQLHEADRHLIKELVARREELGLSQREVARRMDVSQSAVSRIERGDRDLHQSTVSRYAMAVEAVVTYMVIPDDPGVVRSTKMLRALKGQMASIPEVDWSESSGGAQVTWTRRKDAGV